MLEVTPREASSLRRESLLPRADHSRNTEAIEVSSGCGFAHLLAAGDV